MNLVIGILVIGLSIFVIIFHQITIIILIIILAIAILISGIGRLLNAFFNKKLNKYGIITKFTTGLIAIIISVFVLITSIFNPTLSQILFINLYGLTLFLIGIARIIVGAITERYKKPNRILLIFVGFITLSFSLIVMVFPNVGNFVVLLLFSLTLIFNGLARIVFGFYGIRKTSKKT
ncbi:MAG: DUF308 domain-containing protein [Candidatus Hodarchaeota archaeon]